MTTIPKVCIYIHIYTEREREREKYAGDDIVELE